MKDIVCGEVTPCEFLWKREFSLKYGMVILFLKISHVIMKNELDELMCPFCDKQIEKRVAEIEKCCPNMKIKKGEEGEMWSM